MQVSAIYELLGCVRQNKIQGDFCGYCAKAHAAPGSMVLTVPLEAARQIQARREFAKIGFLVLYGYLAFVSVILQRFRKI